MKRITIFLVFLLFLIGIVFSQSKEELLGIAYQTIREDESKDLVHILAHQGLGGRLTGTEDFKLASEILKRELKKIGLEPLGKDYIQRFTLFAPQRFVIWTENEIFEENKDFFLGNPLYKTPLIKGKLAFVGYSITAGETSLVYDDYKNLSADALRGKIAVAFMGSPNDSIGIYIFMSRKAELAKKHGALALIIIYDAWRYQRSNWFDYNTDLLRLYSKVWLELPDELEEEEFPVIFARPAMAAQILKMEVADLKRLQKAIRNSLKTKTVFVDNEVTIGCLDGPFNKVEGRNVLGFVRGEKTDEVIIIGAHFDHLGATDGKVYAGADDNASGTAAVLQIAGALSELQKSHRLKRSAIIAFWGGEEGGLLGSRHFVQTLSESQYPFANSGIIAVINLDMVGRSFPGETVERPKVGIYSIPNPKNFDSLEVARRTPELAQILFEANVDLGNLFTFTFDDRNKDGKSERSFMRSDQASFRDGRGQKPAIFFGGYAHPDYHEPSDLPEKINYRKVANIGRLAFLVAAKLLNSDIRPTLKD